MEIYSDIEYKPENLRICIVGLSACFIPFQLIYFFSDSLLYSKIICLIAILVMCFASIFMFSKKILKLLKKRTEAFITFIFYIIFTISFFIISPVSLKSKEVLDINFYMCIFLMISLFLGYLTGAFFSDKKEVFNSNSIKVRKNEIEIKKIDILSSLSLKKIPFLRIPLTKMKYILYIVSAIIGTGGAGLAIGIAEILKKSDVINPNIGVHAMGFFIIGIPVLFTFGILIYAMIAYLFEWRRLVAKIEKEYGSHNIIFNSQKKSYKKIQKIIAERSNELNNEH